MAAGLLVTTFQSVSVTPALEALEDEFELNDADSEEVDSVKLFSVDSDADDSDFELTDELLVGKEDEDVD